MDEDAEHLRRFAETPPIAHRPPASLARMLSPRISSPPLTTALFALALALALVGGGGRDPVGL